ncbi:DNA adenine methylase [Helicobacter sp. T3_23-1056]
MRFIGNKENLIPKIYDFMQKCGIVERKMADSSDFGEASSHKTFFDAFSGSASVGRFFKSKGFEVVSCDLLYFSYCLQMAYLGNNTKPNFENLDEILREIKTQNLLASPYQKVLRYLNNLEPKAGFIYENYAPSGSKDLSQPRMYFSNENAQKIDAVRLQIESWRVRNAITQNEYFILLATLLESVSFFANVAGVYAAFCKIWDKRALKPFILKEITLLYDLDSKNNAPNPRAKSTKNHRCFCGDCLEILDSHTGAPFDILYLDPPYNHRQYAPNYHLLETIAKYDNPRIKGVAGLREWDFQKSNFCNAKLAPLELEKIAKSPHYKALVLSYNSEGIMSKSQIESILHAQNGRVDFIELDYPRFKSHKNNAQKSIKEFVWILQR